MSKPKSHCLLFDSDGTLVDSEVINTQALADELALHNIVEHAVSLLNRYRGWQFKAVIVDLGLRHNTKFNQNFEQSFRARASRYFETKLQPVTGIRSALQQLTDAKCVASNAPMTKLRQVLEITHLSGFFDNGQSRNSQSGSCLFSAYDISKFKPDPGLFQHAAQQMGFNPNQCIVIEDSVVGVQAAIAAEMKCVWYCPGHHEKAGVESAIADSADIELGLEQKRILCISKMGALPAAISTLKQLPD